MCAICASLTILKAQVCFPLKLSVHVASECLSQIQTQTHMQTTITVVVLLTVLNRYNYSIGL